MPMKPEDLVVMEQCARATPDDWLSIANASALKVINAQHAALRMWDLLAGYDLHEEVDAQALAELCMAHGWRGEVKLDEFVHRFRKRVLEELM